VEHRWSIAPPQPALAGHLARQLGLSPLLAQCLLNRGHSEPDAIATFLEPKLRRLADPFLLPAMNAAVDRLFQARDRGEPVVIFGDYDVDGVSSTALLYEVLRHFGWEVNCYLPHRMDEGYGLSQDGVENCLQRHAASLLLAVDCGSTATETIRWLAGRGIDVIVLDHHQVSDPAPAACALVNPQLNADGAFRELCSAGLAFKLAHALVKRGRETGLSGAADFDLRPLLDLVALGTVADLVPLTRENRILASVGLGRLQMTQRPGLVALKQVAQVREPVGTYEVGFQLGPRLNAAGRLETAEAALQLLLARSVEEALPLAQALDTQNGERQAIERGIAQEVTGAVRARFDPARDYVIVEGQMFWHIGVVGIVASRVLREFYRPTIILGGDGNAWRGSGRSIEGFDLAAALRACDELLLRHGGHAMAAGLSVHPDRVDALRERLNALARNTLSAEQLRPELRIDAEVPLAALDLRAVEDLERLAPFGQGNPTVQLAVRRLSHRHPPRRIGREQRHLKLAVTDGRTTVDAVWWNAPENTALDAPFDLACQPQINAYNGRRTVQLRVLDGRSSA
jgi:single-stranded-DNA-specific exonuclease